MTYGDLIIIIPKIKNARFFLPCKKGEGKGEREERGGGFPSLAHARKHKQTNKQNTRIYLFIFFDGGH